MKTRTRIPRNIQAAVLMKSRRRCALCYLIDFSLEAQRGQIAHIDHNPANNNEDNLCYLCLKHHDEYDSRPSQSKGYQVEELLKAKNTLEQYFSTHEGGVDSEPLRHIHQNKKTTRISPDIYRMRVPVYRAFYRLLRHVNTQAAINDDEIKRFLEGTHEALFLFGPSIEAYARAIFEKAIDLRQTQRSMEHPERYDEVRWTRLVDKEGNCMIWLSEEFLNIKKRFYPFMNI